MKVKLILNNRGITLLEVMISMLVLAFGALGLAPLFVLSVEENITARDNTYVTRLIEEQIEYYVSTDSLPTLPYSGQEQFVYDENQTGYGPDSTGGEGESRNSLLYTRSTVITDHASDSTVPDGLYQITVAVNWNDHQNMQRSSMYSTYLIP
ncbi:MAG: prepilin-type N-terminal cleavage/methylation domain-containing protein [Candidatus Zixiibacteriota bacterium]